jgi:long-chain acyl-CoA synthetase
MSPATALVVDDQTYTRADLQGLSCGLARDLQRRGVRAGDRVALMSSSRPEFVIAILAIWQLGAAVVLCSPSWKQADTAHALAITRPAHAVGDHPILGALMPMRSLDEPISPVRATAPAPDPGSDAALVFSSGTTGLPKAVRHTHASLATAIRQWRDALMLTDADRIQVTTPPSHILGLLNVVTALETGIWMRLHRKFDLEKMLHHIESDRITVEMAVAPIALALASHPRLETYDLSSLRYIMWGATPVTPAVAEAVTRRTGVRWLPAYGASELPVIACNPLDQPRLDSAGRAVDGVRLRVTSLQTGAPVGPDQSGEIEAQSDSLMVGYLPAEATAGAIVDGWYRTGDVGTLDADGWLRLTGRTKEMIKVRGLQVAPAEVEAVIFSHPAVNDCAVFGVPDPDSGEKIIAAVAAGRPVAAAEIENLVGDQLASYKRPSTVVFVPEIPRLPSGKVLRRVLQEQYRAAAGE